MEPYVVHTSETAPTGSQDILKQIQSKMGFVPNLLGIFAESPVALKTYMSGVNLLSQGALNETERQIVFMAASYENTCVYCMAAHTSMAKAGKVPQDVIDALRNDTPISDPKLQALREFVRAMVSKRGAVSEQDKTRFLDAGYTNRHVLEVIVGISLKILTNYTNRIVEPPLDDAFQANQWQTPQS